MLSWHSVKPVLSKIDLLSHWLLSHITIMETKDNGAKGTNPVAMTITNPRKPGIEPATPCFPGLHATD